MQRKPFRYTLELCGPENQDMLFKRMDHIRPVTANDVSRLWAVHMDIADPKPEKVLFFVRTNVPREEIMDEINKLQTYWREQTERRF